MSEMQIINKEKKRIKLNTLYIAVCDEQSQTAFLIPKRERSWSDDPSIRRFFRQPHLVSIENGDGMWYNIGNCIFKEAIAYE